MTPTQTVLSNDRLYNGKELQDGTNWLDYGARMYYPELGRWMAVDPLPDTGGQESWSTYQYVFNNPAKLTDPDGRFPIPFPLIALLPEIGAAATAVAEYAVGSAVGVAVGTGLHKLAHSGVLAGGGNSVVPYNAQLLTKKWEREQSSGSNAKSSQSSSATSGAPAPKSNNKGDKSDDTKDKLKINVPDADKIKRDQLDPPTKHGNAPTFKKDGTSVEIHHEGQKREGPFKEMHWEDHRGKGNDAKNHPNKSQPSQVDRKEFDKAKREYWKQQYPKQ